MAAISTTRGVAYIRPDDVKAIYPIEETEWIEEKRVGKNTLTVIQCCSDTEGQQGVRLETTMTQQEVKKILDDYQAAMAEQSEPKVEDTEEATE